MRTLLLLLVLVPTPGVQDPAQLPKEPIKDWEYRLKDLRHDPQTKRDVEEVTLIMNGKEAIPLKRPKDKEAFDLKGIDARYFTTPTTKEPSREIKVKADRGNLDKGANTLKLDDNVVVRRLGLTDKVTGEKEADTVLLTPSALLRFTRMYQCPVCRKIYGAQGHCPIDGEELRETTITSVETDREFEITSPEGLFSGSGLVTDDAIRREYHIAHDGFVEFSGQLPGSSDPKAPGAAQARFTQIYSRGPLAITGPMDARRIHGEGGARVDRIDLTGTTTLLSETLTLDTLRRWDQAPDGPLDMRTVDAKGDVVVDGVSFDDGESFHVTSDTLLRTISEDDTLDVTVMTAQAPRVVSLTRGPSRIDSRRVTMTKPPQGGKGVSVFEDVVRSDLVAGTEHFSLASGKLVTTAGPNSAGKTDLETLEATEHVVLGGLMAKSGPPSPDGGADPGEARADHFHWDVASNRGWLESGKESSFVRITQGPSTIVAPRVLLESPQIIVLKGPKNVHMIQEREGKKEEYRATCEGDLILDSVTNRLWMRNHCVLRTQEMLLNSDRVNAVLSPGGKGMESLLALGNVRALRESDHTTLHGDRLFYRFADQALRVYGSPRTVADTGHSTSTQEGIRVYEEKHPRTGDLIRYTAMDGGSDGVRIEIDERPAPKPDEPK